MVTKTPNARVQSIDVIRGVVMVLMAIDHVRVYAGQPAGGPTAAIFFTRWVTHFCAPAFVFLAGTGAFLLGRTLGDTGRLARFLITRGVFLVLLEPTVIRFLWTFNVDYGQFVLAGVIWMIGWCMILLAGLVRFSPKTIGITGLLIVVFQQVFRFAPLLIPASRRASIGWIWEFIYPADLPLWDNINVLYVIVPWIGVMAAGYAFGAVMVREPDARRRFCLKAGSWATGLYLVFVCVAVVLLHADEDGTPAIFQALSPPKYPASQPFLLMTLGPTVLLLPFIERVQGRVRDVFATFGRVPMFYYLLHIPAIHIAALVVTRMREGMVHPEWYARAPYTSVPDGHMWSLPLLYLVFVVVVAALYVPCRWFAGLKARRSGGWLSYL